jgi:hypothetical protein
MDTLDCSVVGNWANRHEGVLYPLLSYDVLVHLRVARPEERRVQPDQSQLTYQF